MSAGLLTLGSLLKLGEGPAQLVLRCAVIYLVLLFGLRLFGKREVGQFTLFDLVFVLLVANAVQPSMTGPDTSLTGGLIIIATLVLLNFGVGWLRVRSRRFNALIEPKSSVVARNGRWDRDQLRRQGISDEEGEAALREHGLTSVTQTKLVVLEGDGSLSVVPTDEAGTHLHRRRHVRFIRHG